MKKKVSQVIQILGSYLLSTRWSVEPKGKEEEGKGMLLKPRFRTCLFLGSSRLRIAGQEIPRAWPRAPLAVYSKNNNDIDHVAAATNTQKIAHKMAGAVSSSSGSVKQLFHLRRFCGSP